MVVFALSSQAVVGCETLPNAAIQEGGRRTLNRRSRGCGIVGVRGHDLINKKKLMTRS